ncbi:MAG: hypothetical protein BWK78_09800, partial [Thiotrichaceae bacterium IS1]
NFFLFLWRVEDFTPSLFQSNFYRNLANKLTQLEFYSSLFVNLYENLKDTFSKKDFYTNLVIGVTVTLLLIYFHNHPLLRNIEDEDMDLAMKFRQEFFQQDGKHKIRSDNERDAKEIPGFVFLDIDNRTYEEWGQKPFTPRKELEDLIDFSVNSGAKLVIVDVDLNHPLTVEKESQEDTNLRIYLKEYIKRCNPTTDKNSPNCPPIILVRTFHPLEESSETEATADVDIKPHEPNSSFLDGVVHDKSFPVVWASAQFFSSHNIIRQRWLWQPTCVDKKAGVIPSVELLAATMSCHNTPKTGYDDVLKQLDKNVKPDSCDARYKPTKHSIYVCGEKNKKMEVSGGIDGIQQRIMYSVNWSPSQISDSLVKDYIGDIFTAYSAAQFLKKVPDIDKELFKDKIVVIGGSYEVGGDMSETPIGQMPGAVIIPY